MIADRSRLDRVLNPRTVAIVGDSSAMGYMWTKNNAGVGKLYGVHIDERATRDIEGMGVSVYRSVLDLPEAVDLVIIAVPRRVAPQVVQECVAKGVGGCTLFTAGFAETGEEEGVRLQQQVQEIARQGNLPVVGPNCMGLYLPAAGVRHSPDQPVGPEAVGPLAVVAQSGTHATNLSIGAQALGLGISKSISMGNAIVLDASDYLDYFKDDPATEAIVLYIEGTHDGPRFARVLRETCRKKPVILWKGGRSEAGARAIYSHTASLAAPISIWRALARQAGAIFTETFDETLDAAQALLRAKPFTKKAAALVALTGGQSVSLTDAFIGAGIDVPRMTDKSYRELSEFFQVVGGSYQNPFDAATTIGMGGNADNLKRLFVILDADPNVGMVAMELAVGFQGQRWKENPKELESLLDILSTFRQDSSKPLALIAPPLHFPALAAEIHARIRQRGLPAFPTFDRAAEAMSRAADYHRFRAGLD